MTFKLDPLVGLGAGVEPNGEPISFDVLMAITFDGNAGRNKGQRMYSFDRTRALPSRYRGSVALDSGGTGGWGFGCGGQRKAY